MGMSLDAGGHLTHGFRPNISGKMFHQRSYGTDPETGLLDYAAVAAAAREFKPLVLVAGYSAYPRRVNFAKMREIADEVGATLMVDMAHFAGLVAGKVFTGDEDPVPHAHVTTTTTHKSLRGPRGGLVLATEEYSGAVDKGCPMVLGGPLSHVMAAKAVALAEARQPSFQEYAQRVADNAKALAEGFLKRGARLVTGGTDNHIVLLDVTSFGLTGRQAESALLDAGVVTNRNSIPADPNGAWYSSGIRFGTPALTTRGFGAADFDRVAELVVEVLTNTQPAGHLEGQVHAGRRHRRPGARRVGRTARREPAVPGSDALSRCGDTRSAPHPISRNVCPRVTVTFMAEKPVANALTLELEPVVAREPDRHLATEELWYAHDYVPFDQGENFAFLGGKDWDPSDGDAAQARHRRAARSC